MSLWRLELFGGIQLSGHQTSLTRFRTHKTAALLALLAIKQRSFSREELVEIFWPEAEPAAAGQSLRQALSSLRPILGAALETPPRGGVRLKPGALSTDVADFETEINRARLPATKPTEVILALQRALKLQSSELLPEFYEDWVIQERERLKALRAEAEQQLARWDPPQSEPPLRRPFPRAYEEKPTLRQLPTSLSSFIGRAEECASIQQWWESGQSLLTLTGLGGCGKTRLALQAAEALANRGVATVFVSLAEREDPAQLYECLHYALSGKEMPWKDHQEAIHDQIHALPGRLLVVLDNLEQLIPFGIVTVLRALLQKYPTLSLLVTSRIPLEMEGEQELSLGSLPLDRSLTLLVERARAVAPGFARTNHNDASLQELCHRLGGIPLALELAAAQLRVLSPHGLVELLDEQGSSTLIARRRDLPERHRMLRNALQWSLEQLDPPTRSFFLSLTVFRGGWTLENAAIIAGIKRAEASAFLGTLLRCSLIVRDSDERFSFLVPIFEFASELLAPQERQDIQQKMAQWFLNQAEEFRHNLSWTHHETTWIQQLKGELENLRASLRFLEETDPEKALRLAATLMRFWHVGGLWREGFAWTERLLARCPSAEALIRLRALNCLGNLDRCLHGAEGKGASYYPQSCLDLAREAGDDFYITVSLHNLVLAAWDQGELERAEVLLEELLPRRYVEQDEVGLALTLALQGTLCRARGQLEEAEVILREALGIFRAKGNHWGIVCALNFYVPLELARHQYKAALEKQNEALALAEATDNAAGRAYGLHGLGTIHTALGQHEEAQHAYEEAIQIALELGEHGVQRRCRLALENKKSL